MKIRGLALLCALLVFSQILHADGERQKGRKKERTNTERAGRQQDGSSPRNRKSQNGQGQKVAHKGRFTSKEKAQCTWILSEGETTTLKIDCKREAHNISCVFSGNPSTCPQFSENRNLFWKQITRSLKRQKNICEDHKGILKSQLCRKGPPSAHLRLVPSHPSKHEKPVPKGKGTPAAATSPAGSKNLPKQGSSDCVEDIDYIDQRKVAEEYCSESWLSLCNFFISMVQDKKCK